MGSTFAEEARQLAYPAILEQLAEGVIVTDAVGTIIFVNDAAAAIHGVARLDVKPNAYSEIYSLFREDGRPYPSYELPLARAVRGETVKDARWRIRTPDGRNVLAIGTAKPLIGARGRRIGAVLTLRDDTARDVAERKLHQSEGALREARARLVSRQEARAEKESAEAARGQALRDVSALIRAPLLDVLDELQQLMAAPTNESIEAHGAHMRAVLTALLSVVDGATTQVEDATA